MTGLHLWLGIRLCEIKKTVKKVESNSKGASQEATAK
jgi:hypothetical protein